MSKQRTSTGVNADFFAPVPRSKRARIEWPDGARLAFWAAPNIEFYELDPPENLVRPAWPRPFPDILNWSWRDYGNRVGVWRCLQLFDRYQITGSVSLNAAMCDRLPDIVAQFRDRDWDLFYHGDYNTRYLFGLSPEQERLAIAESCGRIEKFSGKPVRGFLAPALTYTETTFESAAKCGIDYVFDTFSEDQPYPVLTSERPLISIPYQVELNDFFACVAGGLSPSAYVERFKAQFDRLYLEGAHSGRVIGLPLHPYLIGMPNYIWALEEMLAYARKHRAVWFTTAADIADWYRTNYLDTALSSLERP